MSLALRNVAYALAFVACTRGTHDLDFIQSLSAPVGGIFVDLLPPVLCDCERCS